MDQHLDNPIWHALVGPHAPLAIGGGAARHYRFDVAPFSAIAERAPAAYEDLRIDWAPRSEARLFRAAEEPAPPGWETVSARPMLQMIVEDRRSVATARAEEREILPLGASDIDAMLALVELTRPGPFSRGRLLLGEHLGVKRDGRLVAMIGPRLRLPGLVEMSALCAHPAVRKTGIGTALFTRLARDIFAAGDTPFFHVFADNPAIELYRRLGAVTRTQLWVLWYRPVGGPPTPRG
jgi:predicted GNAT family acetyltransferase